MGTIVGLVNFSNEREVSTPQNLKQQQHYLYRTCIWRKVVNTKF